MYILENDTETIYSRVQFYIDIKYNLNKDLLL